MINKDLQLTNYWHLKNLRFRFGFLSSYAGAGFAQGRAGTSKPSWGAWYGHFPYGDDPRDQFWIKQGI